MAESFEQALERERRARWRPVAVPVTVHVDMGRPPPVLVPVLVVRDPDGCVRIV